MRIFTKLLGEIIDIPVGLFTAQFFLRASRKKQLAFELSLTGQKREPPI